VRHSAVNRPNWGRAIRGSQVGLFAALVLTGADWIEQKLLGRPAIYVPGAIARRLFGAHSRFARARYAGVQGLALRGAYSAGLGALYAVLRERLPGSPTRAGRAFGTGIWAFELVAMPAVRAVPPLREWPRAEIALLLGHALVFSMTAALIYDRLAANVSSGAKLASPE
jgi:hypothetical protein